MKKLVILGISLVVAAELAAIVLLDRQVVVWVSGVAVAVVLLAVRWFMTHDLEPELPEPDADESGASLRRWLSRTETLISRSESNRSDWDRHLRPMLARQFEMATGQRQRKDPKAFNATGRMLFGEDLWQWVDPSNVTRTGGREPGPGRTALNDILQRLEKL